MGVVSESEKYKIIALEKLEETAATCKDGNIENITSNRFTALLTELYNICFKNPETGKSKLDIEKLNAENKLYLLFDIYDIFIYISLLSNKVITLYNFLAYTGITKYSMQKYDELLNTYRHSILQAIHSQQESTLFNKVSDGVVMCYALGKVKHGWIEGTPQQAIPSTMQNSDTIADKYKDIKELPKF